MVELAYKLRPTKLDDVGQEQLVSKNKVIYNMVKNKRVFNDFIVNLVLSKTSIANAIAQITLDIAC